MQIGKLFSRIRARSEGPTIFERVCVWSLLTVNTLNFAAWHIPHEDWHHWMSRNWGFSLVNWNRGRYWSLFLSNFSQYNFYDFTTNSFALYYSAFPIMKYIGVTGFFSVYFLGGIANTCLSTLWGQRSTFYEGIPAPSYRLEFGASGASFAAATLYTCMHPLDRFKLFFALPLSSVSVLSLEMLVNGHRTYERNEQVLTPKGHSQLGHLGGSLCGVAAYFFLARRGRVPRGLEALIEKVRPPLLSSSKTNTF